MTRNSNDLTKHTAPPSEHSLTEQCGDKVRTCTRKARFPATIQYNIRLITLDRTQAITL